MQEHDLLQAFLFEHANIRGYIINLTETYQTVINQRAYPPAVKKRLGEAMICCLFLTASIKFEGKLSLQFEGDERLPLLIVQCDNELRLRAMAKYEESLSAEDYGQAFLNGKLSLTLTTASQPNAYQSVVPLHSHSMSENVMHYLNQSEQIPSQIWLASTDEQVAGIMLQLMPDTNTQQQEQFWEYALAMGQTIQAKELLHLESSVLLHRLYHETDLRMFTGRPVRFKCNCSENKMKNLLLLLGETESQQILQQEGKLAINCDFCNRCYQFDAVDVAELFHPQTLSHRHFDRDVEIIKEIKPSPKTKKE